MKSFIRRFTAFLLICVMTLSLCLTALPSVQAADATIVTLNPAEASPFHNGEFQGWGTALCWWANRVGYNELLTQKAVDAFFSEEGLSLDIARYNIGGGDDRKHNHVTRSDSVMPGLWESFEWYNYDQSGNYHNDVRLTYDITNDKNQLKVAKAALAANPDLYFEGFSNSAPYFMTKSYCTGGVWNGETDNLKPEMYDDFARYIAECTKLLAEEGIVFQSYSPMNEPSLNGSWTAQNDKQEGCPVSMGANQDKLLSETRKALDDAGLSYVLVAGMDDTNVQTTLNSLNALSTEGRNALGRIDTHTYFNDVDNTNENCASLKAKALELGKDLWMSEVDLGEAVGESEMKGALWLGQRILRDMNYMQPAAWVMWNIIDTHQDADFVVPAGTKYYENGNTEKTVESDWYREANNLSNWNPDGGMWGVALADHDDDTLHLSQKYYGYGQFTKYINPGDTIISTNDNDHILAAYNKKTGDIKIVAVNATNDNLPYQFNLSAFPYVGTDVQVIRTSGDFETGEHWASVTDGQTSISGSKLTTTLKANSITTYVIKGIDVFDFVVGTYSVLLNGKALRLSNSGAQLVTPDGNDLCQKLTVNSDGEGYYTICATDDSGNVYYLDVSNEKTENGASVGAYQYTGGDNQKWLITRNDDGSFSFIGKQSGRALTVNSDGSLVISTYTGEASQKASVPGAKEVVYNTATIYDYSTAYCWGDVNEQFSWQHTEDLQIGKTDYNWDLAKKIYNTSGYPSNHAWNGIFFGTGGNHDALIPQLERIDLSDAEFSSSTHQRDDNPVSNYAAIDGIFKEKAWDTWDYTATNQQSGEVTAKWTQALNGLQEVKAYFYKPMGDNTICFPTSVTLTVVRNGNTYTFENATFNVTAEDLCEVTFSNLGWLDGVTEMRLSVATTTEDTSQRMVLSELEAYGDTLGIYRKISAGDVNSATSSYVQNYSGSAGNWNDDNGWCENFARNGYDKLFNDNKTEKAWTSVHSVPLSDDPSNWGNWSDCSDWSWIEVTFPKTEWVYGANLYFIKETGWQDAAWPERVQMCSSSDRSGPLSDQITDFVKLNIDGQEVWKATLRFNVDSERVGTDKLRFWFKTQESGKYVEVSEIEILTYNTYFSEASQWTGYRTDKEGSLKEKQFTAWTGLANSTLNEAGDISFTVPEAGLFTQERTNKSVYNNIRVPYVYDSETGYYTFSTNPGSSEYPGTDVHFPTDSSGDLVISDNQTLVMDTTRYYPKGAELHTPGFFPFNIGTDNTATDDNGIYTADQETDYHFGMQTTIEFFMTPDGKVAGASDEHITFDFDGDDDVWVYIDGKLVLDIGGIHSSMWGKIDFADNKAYVQNGATGAPTVQTLFGGADSLFGVTLEEFAEQGKHTMKVFYLERGASESNCLIRYNMPRASSIAPETIVLDYGLPVKIDIMANDFSNNGLHEFMLTDFTTANYGKVRVLNEAGNEVSKETYNSTVAHYYFEYTPTTYLSDIDTITYTYSDPSGDGSKLQATVTIVPATSMYYEENFKNEYGTDYITTTNDMLNYSGYTPEGSTDGYAKYQEDGVVGTVDDSTYGTDKAYLTSLPSAGDSHGTSYHFDTTNYSAAFKYTFTGTGTAIFARTSPTSAYIRINIKDNDGNNYFNFTNPVTGGTIPYVFIDTKYNVKDTTLYNIPVYNIEDMPYGEYTVTVTIAKPSQWYEGQKDFYLDGIRVYNPMGAPGGVEDDAASTAYETDHELDPSVMTLRDAMLTENVSVSENESITFINASGKSVPAANNNDTSTVAWSTETHGHLGAEQEIAGLYSVKAYFSANSAKPLMPRLYCYTKDENGNTARDVVLGSVKTLTDNNNTTTGYEVTFLPLTTETITKLLVSVGDETHTGSFKLTEIDVFTDASWSNQGKGFVVFTDTVDTGATSGTKVTTVKEYESFGPKQEVYLNETAGTSGQQIGFVLNGWSDAKNKGAKLYLGMKTPNGSNATVTINSTEFNLKNTVDCYYDITDAIGDNGVIVITTNGFVSLTNLKGIGYEVTLASDSKSGKLLLAAMHVNEETPADPITDGSLGFKQASLTLSSDISVNFYVSDSTLEGWEAPYVVFSKAIYDTNGSITGDQEETVSTFTLKTSGDEACHVFTFSGINAAEMGSEITATLYASKDGVVYEGQTVPYSVLQYANNMLAKSDDAELHTLLVDLLNYGAEAQSYFGYNTANPVNAGLTDEQKACATQTVPELTTCKGITKNDGATVGFKAVSLLLEEKVTLNYYLDLSAYDGTAEELYLRVTYPDADGTAQESVIDGSAFVNRVDADGKESLLVNFSGLNATQMRTMCTAEVFSKITGERVSDTATYSVESYAYSKAGGSDGALNMLLEMMMKYGDSASRFFAK